ncbi:MAG TPA: Glu-tRNA(Gln) amidotransferase subunit GatE [Candidatus Krumholzibacteria bacterium]|nr:Glu-tRNA(Gln) amidotransferase subunit GatE [Candidatus Krumholzibacteria bacterium]
MDDRLILRDPWLLRPLPVYGELDAAGYAELGFKCGLEVHQQLLTDRKLFCRCPAGRYDSSTHHAEVLRHMRPTLSEMGEYDGTALMEFKTRKNIIYLLNNDTVCTYEMDDAPPFEIDAQALDRAIAVTMMLGCSVVGEVHITRKQYLDGSIPTGFQRTAIIGTDGDIPFDGRTVHIRQLSIEEDSCREVSDTGHVRTYRTDRLGMPLIETVTDPDMRTPLEAMQVGQALRWLCRASGLVRTGAGAARQDVNVSVTGGTRIEIKGVPSLRAIPRLTHNEALRQRTLVGIAGELARRGIRAEAIADRGADVTAAVRGTGCRFIRRAIEKGAVVQAIALPGFQGLLELQTQPRTSFLKEFSDRIRVIACLDELPNLAVSTQDVPTLSSGEWDKVARACGVGPDVPVIVVWGSRADTDTAVREIVLRARDAVAGVPAETRQALDDGTTGFERILPGADRMYPDTDLPPIALADPRVDTIRAGLPPRPWEREAEALELGVGADLAARLARHRAWPLFAHLVPRLAGGPVTPRQLASLLLDRSNPRPASLTAAGAWWEEIAAGLQSGALVPEGVWCGDDEPIARIDDDTARRRLRAALADLPAPLPADRERREHAAMGHVMPALRGAAPGALVRRWLKEDLA